MNNVLTYLNDLLYKDDTIVVATSGGPDSMCLLHLLCDLKKGLSLKIVIAHVNHKLREESEEEALFVESFAKENDLIYEYMEIKEYNNDNLESEARQKRYEFFKKLINKYHALYLMTAHHGDDLIETIMMRLVRGSSIKGYSGFKKQINMGNYKIIRPLISLTKKDIINYMDKNNYKYYIDKSNYSDIYTRNRYRMNLLPFLKSEDKNVHLKFLKFSEELEQVNVFLDKYISNILKDMKEEQGLNITKLLELDEFLIKKIIEHELSLIYINDLFLVSDKNTLAIIELLKNNRSTGYINLPNDYIALKEYNYLKIVNNTKEEVFKYVLDNEVKLNNGIIKVVKESNSTSNFVLRLNSKNIKLPIIIRSRLAGDKIAIKNLNGTKKVKDILIDEKISYQKRKNISIVTDSENNVLWIPGIKKSKFDVKKDENYDIILSYEEDKNEC
ncbi:MAG: tRNA lysidine(34) synthetase TilS [Firmicutes bacterium]|nr:tRNA lysidine(34) synthetase TilS [Bacillota bacterium]